MNKDQADGNWKQLKGKREQLVGKIQERYGYQKEAAEKEVKAWEDHTKHRW